MLCYSARFVLNLFSAITTSINSRQPYTALTSATYLSHPGINGGSVSSPAQMVSMRPRGHTYIRAHTPILIWEAWLALPRAAIKRDNNNERALRRLEETVVHYEKRAAAADAHSIHIVIPSRFRFLWDLHVEASAVFAAMIYYEPQIPLLQFLICKMYLVI